MMFMFWWNSLMKQTIRLFAVGISKPRSSIPRLDKNLNTCEMISREIVSSARWCADAITRTCRTTWCKGRSHKLQFAVEYTWKPVGHSHLQKLACMSLKHPCLRPSCEWMAFILLNFWLLPCNDCCWWDSQHHRLEQNLHILSIVCKFIIMARLISIS
jgi:hypothetical protein